VIEVGRFLVKIWPRARYWNIAFRTAHIVAAAALFGGHVFDTPPQELLIWLYLTLFTGAILAALEAYPHFSWCYEARGLCVWGKILLLGCVPLFWDNRVPILIAVLVIASIGSHMPRRYRHFSILHGRVLDT